MLSAIVLILLSYPVFTDTLAGDLAPGEIDPSFTASDGRALASGDIDGAQALLVQSDGKAVLIGSAGSFGNFTLIRYNTDGSLDSSFGTGGKVSTPVGIQGSSSRGGALQPDGKIVAVGLARADNTSSDDFAVLRYNSDGSLDSSFGNGGKVLTSFTPTSFDYAEDVVLQPDGKIVVSGNSNGAFAAARYNSDGTLDASFGTGGKVTVTLANSSNYNNSVALQADGKILLAGNLTIFNPPQEAAYVIGVARLNPNGTLDNSFDADGKVATPFGTYANCGDLQVQPDGQIVLVGAVSPDSTGYLDFAILRYNPDGSLDTSFGSGGNVATSLGNFDDQASSIAFQPNGQILVAGTTRINSEDSDFALVRYNPNGSLDTNFGLAGTVVTTVAAQDSAGIVALQSDGKILAAGYAQPIATQRLPALVRYDANGKIDQDFGFKAAGRTNVVVRGMIDEATAVLIQPDGKILSAGRSRITNRYCFSLVRQNRDGTLDQNFGNNGTVATKIGTGDTDSDARAMAIQPDGKIVTAGGFYDPVLNQTYMAVVRYQPDGSLDPAFDGDGTKVIPAAESVNQAYAVALQSDGKILLAGYNDVLPGPSTNWDASIVRLNADGSLDTSFDNDGIATVNLGNARDTAYAMRVQADGKIVIGGVGQGAVSFTQSVLARLNSDGSLDPSFGTGGIVMPQISSTANEIRSLAIQPDGKIVTAGSARVGSVTNLSIARYNNDGSPDLSFGTSGKILTATAPGSNDTAAAVLLQADGRIIVAGTSTLVSDSNLALVRYRANGSLDPAFGSNGIVISDFNSSGTSRETTGGATLQGDGKLVVVGGIRNQTAIGIGSDRRDFLAVRYETGVASSVSISGRVTTPSGNALRNAAVLLTDAQGNRRISPTSSFGIYTFENIEAGQSYTISISSKRYRFAPQSLSPNTNLQNIDFTGLE